MSDESYIEEPTAGAPIKAWVRGVPVEEAAWRQLRNVAALPIIHGHVAAMPDVHWGMGATVGSVIPTKRAIVPAAVGVDIGCGMVAQRTSLSAADLPDGLKRVRAAIEAAVPHGRTHHGGRNDRGAWGEAPHRVAAAFLDAAGGRGSLDARLARICEAHARLEKPARRAVRQLGTLGTGNHFIELCLDEADRVWVMLHSGSRGIGNAIGRHFIAAAKKRAEQDSIALPDKNLAWLAEGTVEFDDYVEAVGWAQDYARLNRRLMVETVVAALRAELGPFTCDKRAVNCHHNYVARERHFGALVWVTRKGAVRARAGDLGIIPGSMGAASYIVRGKGNAESLQSCAHGAGRAMSRTEAKRRFSEADHAAATAGVECRKDAGVIDETPMAYKDIDAVMAAQTDLVEVVHTLRQVVCVKG